MEENFKVMLDNVEIECLIGDITSQPDIDVVVNAANKYLAPGGGVAGAIHKKAGSLLYEECKKYAPINTGESVITAGYNLPNPYVIHTVGPVYSKENNPAEKLSSCFINSLKLADNKGLCSIAFPAISTGIFGYPIEEAAEVSLKAVIGFVPELKTIKKIRFVLFDEHSFVVFSRKLKELYERKGYT
ncbi:MAG: O-acetyl-ADP-ribose deacetylase [candidate division TA06 bacterium ADurb.Bin131]|jgi:O-acetyl-ADP-ribose deacetylase (regulator of RNase III)|uniref:O-acetyl-ADP-ribose deacetylase n=1 Tax=candidate division TA06 bacterium ADurb.Bin131 TaxID=1852827 RepID=A0A1V6CBB3_UNCT6|nr:MAG: O-acetyl-ADP-ribose deacetylase [candidate division TA06 bacterium ADurb.Bin131]